MNEGLTPQGAWAQFKDCLFHEASTVRLLGTRGFFHPGGNQNGVYDDLITLCVGPDQCFNYRASTDPGKYYLAHPMKESGCARLLPGLYWYSIGLHLGKHEALVQASAVDVERLDENEKVRSIEKDQWIGANIHSGGSTEEVGKWSAGCQVIHSPEGPWEGTWLHFLGNLKNAINIHFQRRIPYLLTEKALNVAPL